jgi:hypothetical protein
MNMLMSMFMPNMGAFFSTQSPLERMVGMSYQEQLGQAMGGVQGNPADILRQFTDMKDGADKQSFLKQHSAAIGMAASLSGNTMVQNIVDRLPGMEQYAMAPGILQGMAYMEGGSRWMQEGAGTMAADMATQMQGMNLNLMPRQAGQMFAGLARRGMMPGRMSDMGAGGDTARMSETIKEWDKTISKLQDVFGDDIPNLMRKLDTLTQGGLQGVSSGRMDRIASNMRRMQVEFGLSAEAVDVLGQQGAAIAQSYGLNAVVGVEQMYESYGQATALTGIIGARGAGDEFTGMSTSQRADVEMRRRMLEQKSKRGVAAGGLLSVVSETVRQEGKGSGKFGTMSKSLGSMGANADLIDLVKRLEDNDPSAMEDLKSMKFSEISKMAESIGISGPELWQRMTQETDYSQAMTSQMGGALREASDTDMARAIAVDIRGAVGGGVATKTIQGAILALRDAKDLAPEGAKDFIKNYLLENTDMSEDEADAASGRIGRSMKHVLGGKRKGITGGYDQFLFGKQAAAAEESMKAMFGEMEELEEGVTKAIGSKALMGAAMKVLFSTEEDPSDVISGLSDAGKKTFQQLRPMMQRYRKMAGDPNASEEDKKKLLTEMNALVGGLDQQSIQALKDDEMAKGDKTDKSEAGGVVKSEKVEVKGDVVNIVATPEGGTPGGSAAAGGGGPKTETTLMEEKDATTDTLNKTGVKVNQG